MKAITVKQPWGELIASGAKRVENRTWRTHYRGPLLIHAAKNRHRPGEIVAIADLIDCVRLEDAKHLDFAEGPWCWLLSNIRRLEPIPCEGKQRLFNVPWPQ
jgi:hypothetical protein